MKDGEDHGEMEWWVQYRISQRWAAQASITRTRLPKIAMRTCGCFLESGGS